MVGRRSSSSLRDPAPRGARDVLRARHGNGTRDGAAERLVAALGREGVHASVLIATFNRAALLDDTLESIRRLRTTAGRDWEVIVVDNNSTDTTRAVVERHQQDFPVRLRYLFEARQGRSSALNAGIENATGTIIVMTDDDIHVAENWLEAACNALGGGEPAAYVGGPVRPMWESAPPTWLDLTRGDPWGTIAIQDHGDRPFVYEEARKVPLGANMA